VLHFPVAQLAGIVGGTFDSQSVSDVHASPIVPSVLASEPLPLPVVSPFPLLHEPELSARPSAIAPDSDQVHRIVDMDAHLHPAPRPTRF
jgi:hypothetical protein